MDMIFSNIQEAAAGSSHQRTWESSIKIRVLFGYIIALAPDFWFSHSPVSIPILQNHFKNRILKNGVCLSFKGKQIPTKYCGTFEENKHWKLEHDSVVTQCHEETLKCFSYTDVFSESRAFSRYWKGKLMTGIFTASKRNHRKMIPWHRPRRWHYSEAPGFFDAWEMKAEPGKI